MTIDRGDIGYLRDRTCVAFVVICQILRGPSVCPSAEASQREKLGNTLGKS